jgi:hypothetical protein
VSTLVFEGVTQDGAPVKVIQHVGQLNFMMISVAKLGSEKPKIGLITD